VSNIAGLSGFAIIVLKIVEALSKYPFDLLIIPFLRLISSVASGIFSLSKIDFASLKQISASAKFDFSV